MDITLPDGTGIKSTHTCELDIPKISKQAQTAHIVPELKNTSLISIKQLCNGGCRVTFTEDECKVYHKNDIIWIGKREPLTELWILPLTLREREERHMVKNLYQMSSKESIMRYIHQALFSPVPKTLFEAIKNNQLLSFPGLTEQAVKNIYSNYRRQTRGTCGDNNKVSARHNKMKNSWVTKNNNKTMTPTRS